MAYVTHGCKELKTKYKADTAEAGKEMRLKPQEGTLVSRRALKGLR